MAEVWTDPKTGKKFVAIVDKFGEVSGIPLADLESGRAAKEGLKAASPAQVEERRKQKKFGEGVVTTVRSGAEAVARGATLGLADPALVATGLATPEGLRERQARNEIVSVAGEAVGVLAPILATAGAGAAPAAGAQVAGRGALATAGRAGLGALRATPAAVLARGGRALETALAPAGSGALRRVAGSTVAAGAEGALFGAGQAASEAALEDTDLTAERILAHMKTGAVLGGTAGGLLTSGVAGLSKLVPKVAEWTPALLGKATKPQALEKFVGETAFAAGKGPAAGKKFVERAKRSFVKHGDDALAVIGRHGLDEGVVTKFSTVDDIARAATAKTREWGQKIGNTLRQLDDEAAIALRPNRAAIAKRLDDEVLRKLKTSKIPDFQNMARRMERTLDPFLAEGQFARTAVDARTSFTELHSIRRELDDLVYRTDRASPVIEELRKARAVIEDELERTADVASKRLGEDFAGAYTSAKEKFSAMKIFKEMSEDASARLDTNRNFSMSDMQVAQVAGAGEALTGGGLDLGSLAFGFAAGRVHRFVRQRGAAFVAGTLDRTSAFTKTNTLKAASDSVGSQTKSSVSKFFKLADEAKKTGKRLISPAAARLEEPEPLARRYQKKAAEHRRVIDNPAIFAQRATDIVGGAGSVAPRMSMAVTSTTKRAADFLAAKQPAPNRRASDVFAHLDKEPRVSETEMAKYLRYTKAVEDPLSVVKGFADGTVTREGAEVLREVYPNLFAEVDREITEQVVNRKEPLSYESTLRLSMLLDRPLHPSMEPKYIARAQMVHAANRRPRQPPTERPAPDLAKQELTASQQAAV